MIGLEQMTPAGQENTEPVVMPDDEVLYELADLFRVFGDSTRIKILYALHDNELCSQSIPVGMPPFPLHNSAFAQKEKEKFTKKRKTGCVLVQNVVSYKGVQK